MLHPLKSVTHGINTDPSDLALDVINEHGHPSPGFLTSDHTLKHMKQDVYYSDYTGRTQKSYEDWYEKAHTRVKKVLDRQPADYHLDPMIRERLAAVEARLNEDNVSWRTGEEGWWRFYVQDL
jgi:trimethylamine:corrinoid methyltransferase-like protein